MTSVIVDTIIQNTETPEIFDLRNSNCYRCKLNCNIAIQYREHFYCEKCHNCLQSVNYNIIKFLRNREIHI